VHQVQACVSGRDRRSVAVKRDECTNLVEVDTRQGLLDERLKLIPRSCKGDIGLVSLATATSEQGNDTALPIKDNGARVTAVGEGATPTIGHNGGLKGGEVGIIGVIVAHKGLETINPTNGCARGRAILDHRHRGVTVGVALCGVTDLALGHSTGDLEQAVLWVLIASPVGNIGIQKLAVGLLVDIAPCVIKYKYEAWY